MYVFMALCLPLVAYEWHAMFDGISLCHHAEPRALHMHCVTSSAVQSQECSICSCA